jgi:CubicO group peptidase (beta-lactamase class C family)
VRLIVATCVQRGARHCRAAARCWDPRPYADYIEQHVFAPAGMSESSMRGELEFASPKARAYTRHSAPGTTSAELQPAGPAEVVPNPASNAWCTANDLLQFARALLDDRLVGASMRQTLFTPRHAVEGGGALGETYAYGFFLTGTAQTPRIGHGGEMPGRNAFFEILPSLSAVVIVLANLDPPAASWVGERIVHWLAPR